MSKLLDNITDDLLVFGRAINRMFWEIVDEAERTRTRLRIRRDLTRLAVRETALYEQLGHIGCELLRDGVSVERTPDVSGMLAEIERLSAQQQKQCSDLLYPETVERSAFPWHRLGQLIESGEWVIHAKRLPDSSTWCGSPMTAEAPTGLCLAIKRGDEVLPFSPSVTCLGGDLLLILAPASSVSDWDQWISRGSTKTIDER